jgi:hypothetical protein
MQKKQDAPRAAGYTIYFEVAARDENGVAYDSNVVGVTFQKSDGGLTPFFIHVEERDLHVFSFE